MLKIEPQAEVIYNGAPATVLEVSQYTVKISSGLFSAAVWVPVDQITISNDIDHPRGTKVKVVEQLTGHPFEVGQTVSLGKYFGSGKCYLAEDGRGLTGFLHISEFETL